MIFGAHRVPVGRRQNDARSDGGAVRDQNVENGVQREQHPLA
jgi:hypothetical protein